MDTEHPGWELAAILPGQSILFHRTMQDGLLLVPRDGEPVFWGVRKEDRRADRSNFGHP